METDTRNPTDRVAEGLGRDEDESATFPPAEGVYGQLFREGYHFNFFQAVRLLEKYFHDAPAPGETWDVRRERIFFQPHKALVFPAADIKRIEALAEPTPRARLVLTFLGLYGVDSPLPVYFYDDLASERPGTVALQDFLDIFNHRLYVYFYKAWRKYRPYVGHGTLDEDRRARRFLSVAGLGTQGALVQSPLPNALRLAGFAGWLAPHARHPEGVQKLLAVMLGGPAVKIEENVLRWVPLPERPTLAPGGGFDLGKGAVIGARVPDRSGKFRVVIGPVDFDDYLTFRPGQTNACLVAFLVRLYAPDYLDYDVELWLDTSNIPPVRLGFGDVQLGMTMWLGQPPQAVIAVRVRYD
jgi:type VI secretion system protein ImpH